MTDKQNAQFEIINNSLWILIKPYAKENEKVYKSVMSELFMLFIRDRGKRYTDEWWESWKDIYECPEKYKANQQVCGFAAELADSLYRWIEFESKHKDATMYDFFQIIGKVFLDEWEHMRGRNEMHTQ